MCTEVYCRPVGDSNTEIQVNLDFSADLADPVCLADEGLEFGEIVPYDLQATLIRHQASGTKLMFRAVCKR